MAKYRLSWTVNYEEKSCVRECDSLEEAEELAYQMWKEEIEDYAMYSAILEEDAEEPCL